MQYHIGALLIALASALPHSSGNTMEKPVLSITLRCTDNAACIFTGADMPIEVLIKNEASQEIGVPVKFLQMRGPSVTLTDNPSQAKTILKTGMADHALKTVFTRLRPGESAVVTSIVKDRELRSFRADYVDLTAEVGISAQIQVAGAPETVQFRGSGQLKIIGKDTLERDAAARK